MTAGRVGKSSDRCAREDATGASARLAVTHFLRKPSDHAYSMETLYEDVRKHSPPNITYRLCYSPYVSQGLWRRVANALRARRFQSTVNHVTGHDHYLTYFLNSRRTILTIHDCGILDLRSGLERFLLWLFWFWIPSRRCAAIVTVSEFTKRRLLHFLNCDPSKIHVIHNTGGCDLRPTATTFNAACPRILVVGTTAHKNIERYVEALVGISCHLVIVGQLNESQQRALAHFPEKWLNLKNLSREEIRRQYELCDLVLFASTYEGFGLPIVEGQACGRPVVTSNIASMPEVAGDAACLVDPFDAASIRAGVLRVIQDSAYRKSLVEAGKNNASRFDAVSVASKYCDLYARVASSRQPTPLYLQ